MLNLNTWLTSGQSNSTTNSIPRTTRKLWVWLYWFSATAWTKASQILTKGSYPIYSLMPLIPINSVVSSTTDNAKLIDFHLSTGSSGSLSGLHSHYIYIYAYRVSMLCALNLMFTRKREIKTEILGEELPAFAKEVLRVKARIYSG